MKKVGLSTFKEILWKYIYNSTVMFFNIFLFCLKGTLRPWEDTVLSSNKPHCHPRLAKPHLKILLINWNILEKQLSQASSCSNHSLQIYTKVSNIFTESNTMVNVVRYLPKSEAAVHRYLQPLIGKHLFMSSFLNKVVGVQPKKDSWLDVFQWVFVIL